MGLFQPKFYTDVETVDPSALMIWQIPNESGDEWVPVQMRSMSMASLIAQVTTGGLSVVSPLVLSMGVLSIAGLTGVGNSNQVVTSNGTAWVYTNSTGSGNIVRAGSPTLTGNAIAANLTIQGNLLVGSNTGQSIALGGANDLVGLFGQEPVAQPEVTGTAFPNPVTQTSAFMAVANQVLSGLLQLGALKTV